MPKWNISCIIHRQGPALALLDPFWHGQTAMLGGRDTYYLGHLLGDSEISVLHVVEVDTVVLCLRPDPEVCNVTGPGSWCP